MALWLLFLLLSVGGNDGCVAVVVMAAAGVAGSASCFTTVSPDLRGLLPLVAPGTCTTVVAAVARC